jgi:O-antigen ligase
MALKRSAYSSEPTVNVRNTSLISAVLVAIGIVVLLSADERSVLIFPFAILVLMVGLYGIRYALEHPSWFIFALIIEETLPYFNVIPIDPGSRWFLRFPLLFPLALPALWEAFSTGILFRGRFGMIFIFFLWGAVTLSYSLNPVVSGGRWLPDFLLFATICYASLKIEGAEDVQVILGRFVLGCGLLQIATGVAYLFFPVVLGGSGDTLRATWMTDQSGLSRFCGVFNEPNAVGSLMLVTIGTGFAHWDAVTTRCRKALLAASMASALFFAIAADSRSETAAALIGCVAYGVWKYRWRAALAIASTSVIALLSVSLFATDISPYLNRGLDTMTGRTDAWSFEVTKATESPIFGYGYQSEGEILKDPRFRNWEENWNRGSSTPLHNGYMTLVIGTGIPATLFWLILFVGPWWCLFRDSEDPWNLKPLAFLVIIPAMLLAVDESGFSEPRYVRGLLLFMCWAMAERYQMVRRLKAVAARRLPTSRWSALFASAR